MESKGGKKKSSSSSLFYEAPLGYTIEDVRPNGGIKKFRSAAYSNVSSFILHLMYLNCLYLLHVYRLTVCSTMSCLYAVHSQAILSFRLF